MRKMFKYRLYPTAKQKNSLRASLDACRWVYNETLATRKRTWENRKEFLSLYDTNNLLVEWKDERPDLTRAFSQCLQNAQLRVDMAFKAFFRRIKVGEKPGFPRFRSFDRYDSFTFPQMGFRLTDSGLKISKVGKVRIIKHREIEGKIKTLTIRRDATEKWWAVFSCETETQPMSPVNTVVGIDVGLETFATLSNGEKVGNPRFFKTEETKLAVAHRKLSATFKGTAERVKRRKIVAHIYNRITNKRRDFAHKVSSDLVKRFQVIAFEKLNIKEMGENSFKGIRKSIGDVAWGQLMQFTTYKAECAGRIVVFVDPRNTSKKCSRCGQLVEKKLSNRVHSCSCGLVLDRDHNASINILALGMESLRGICLPSKSP